MVNCCFIVVGLWWWLVGWGQGRLLLHGDGSRQHYFIEAVLLVPVAAVADGDERDAMHSWGGRDDETMTPT